MYKQPNLFSLIGIASELTVPYSVRKEVSENGFYYLDNRMDNYVLQGPVTEYCVSQKVFFVSDVSVTSVFSYDVRRILVLSSSRTKGIVFGFGCIVLSTSYLLFGCIVYFHSLVSTHFG